MGVISDIIFEGKKFCVLELSDRNNKENLKAEGYITSQGGTLVENSKEADYVLYRTVVGEKTPEFEEAFKYMNAGAHLTMMPPQVFWYIVNVMPVKDMDIKIKGSSYAIVNVNVGEAEVISKYILGRGGVIAEVGNYDTDYIIYSKENLEKSAEFKKTEGSRATFLTVEEFGYTEDVCLFMNEKKAIADFFTRFNNKWEFRKEDVLKWTGFFCNELIKGIAEKENIFAIGKLLEGKEFYHNLIVEGGFASPYALATAVDEYIDLSIKHRRNNITAWLLEYRKNHFTQDFIDEAEEDKSDLEFGMRDLFFEERFPECNYRGEYLVGNTSAEDMEKAEVGDDVYFGTYSQGPYGEPENILWNIVKKEGTRLLLVSRKALGIMRYNNELKDVTWETCTMRRWLNGQFFDSAFNADEQEMVKAVKIVNEDNPKFGTFGGNDTIDKVFLLSIREVNEFYPEMKSRSVMATGFAKGKKIYTAANGACWWFLRSPGKTQDAAASVHGNGRVMENGEYVSYDINGMRPALWIDIANYN